MTNSIFDLSNYNLTLLNTNNAASISGTMSASNMIVTNGSGYLIESLPSGSPGTYIFPLGSNVGADEYSPCTLSFSANSNSGTIGCQDKNATHPDMGSVLNYLQRYWSFITTGLTNYTYTASFVYNNADIQDNIANINAVRWDGVIWNPFTSTTTNNILAITTSPLNQTTSPLNNSDFSGRETALFCTDLNILLCEPFYNPILPGGWSNTIITGTQGWTFTNTPTLYSNSGGDYAVFNDEVLGISGSHEAALVSPVINCLNRYDIKLSYNTYWFAEEDTHGYVEVSNDGGNTWNIVSDYEKAAVGSLTVPAVPIFDISAYAANQSNVKIRFRYKDGGEVGKYWYIDDIKVYCEADAGIVSLVAPPVLSSSRTYGSTENVTVRIWNYGVDAISNVPVTCQITGGITQTLTGIYSGTIPGQSYANYTFPTQVNLSADASYNF